MTRLIHIVFLIIFAPPLACGLARAARPQADATTLVVVVGAPGEDRYATIFAEDLTQWRNIATSNSLELHVIGDVATAGDQTDKHRLQSVLTEELNVESTAALWLVFIGHGTFDGRSAAFNLRGPDVGNAELAEWLKPAQRPLVVVDTTAASAPFLTALSGPNRVIVAATKSGQQRNYARFGRYFVKRITDPAADLDKDDQTSLLEAFLAAARDTAEFYKNEGRLATEHPLLDDDGDGRGVRSDFFQHGRVAKAATDGKTVDGDFARRFHLRPSAAEQSLSADQLARRDELEAELTALRRRKAELSEDAYFAELERVLVALARLYEN
jgi:hypothetical protein